MNDDLIKCPRQVGMDRALASPRLIASEADGVPVPERATTKSEGHGESNVEVHKWYFGDRFRANVLVNTVSLDWNVALERPLSTGGCDWECIDVTDYVLRDELLHLHCFVSLSVEGRAMRITVKAKPGTSAYDA